MARLQHRLGMAYFFPFFQPENAKFQLAAGKNIDEQMKYDEMIEIVGLLIVC